ncbi:MAG: gliding motility-associated-like protein [Crocinitomix sp.]|jgi:gliding motility-associated-like protein
MKILSGFLTILFCIHFNHGITQNNSRLKFIPNQGQIADRDFKRRPDVLYQVEGKGIFFKENGVTFVLTNFSDVKHEAHEKMEEVEHSKEGLGNHSETDWELAFLRKSRLDIQQVSMTFLNTSENITIEKFGKSNAYLNYYLPQCPEGVTHVNTYDGIEFRDLYRGINTHYYTGENGELKYDIRVEPNADPDQIKINWTGANNLSLQKDGSLLIETQIRDLTETMPLVYQIIKGDTIEVDAAYKIKQRVDKSFVVTYELGQYNLEYELIIDPWITNYGGEGLDIGADITTDSYNNVLMTGLTDSPTAIAEDGFINVLIGEGDAYVVKFDPFGERIWGTYYGGEAGDDATSIVTDLDNNVYFAGNTFSEEGISFLGHQNEHGGIVETWLFNYGDAFLVKLTSEGMRVWGTYYGGENGENGKDVSVNGAGIVLLTGNTNSDTGIASLEAFQAEYGGEAGGPEGAPGDAFLAIFNSDGDRIWGTYYGGPALDYGEATFGDDDGNIYLCGSSTSISAISTPGAFQESNGGVKDAYLVKFTSSCERVWGTYFGGELQETGADLTIEDTENVVYLTGYATSPSGIAYEGFQMLRGGADDLKRDAYLAKFTLDGERIWSTYLGGEGNDYAIDLDLDKENGNVAICGDTYSPNFPISDCAIQTDLIGLENAFAAQFTPSGELYCSSYFGSVHEEENKLVFGGCYLYVSGTTSASFGTPGAHQEENGGEVDAYIVQLYKSSCGIELPIIEFITDKVDVTACNICDGEFTVEVSTAGCVGNSGGINYRWSSGEEFLNTTDSSSTIYGLCAGDHWVEIQLGCGIKDTIFFELGTDLNIPTVEFEWLDACVGEPIEFVNLATTIDGTFVSFQWSIDNVLVGSEEEFTHIFDSPGTYEVRLYGLNSSDCSDSTTHEITIHPNFEGVQNIQICVDSLYTLPDGTQIIVVNDYTHSSILSTINGCDSIIVTTITSQPNSFNEDTIFVDYGSSVYLSNGEQVEIFETLLDTFTLVSSIGCDSIIVTTYLIQDFTFSPPNIFSPNGDDANNTFFFPQENVATFECVIVDRWGIEVFQFNSITDKWDGKNAANGKVCSDGVYFYSYNGTFINNEPFQGQGTVQLISGK